MPRDRVIAPSPVLGRAVFKKYLTEEVTSKYPFLDIDTIQYRLLKTSAIGNDYELQCKFPSSDQKVKSDGVTYNGEDCVSN